MKKNNKTIIQELVMCKLHVEFDTGYRSSKEMQDLIADEKGAAKSALRTGVLVISRSKTSEFTGAVSRLRTHYLEESLPWDKGNWRVVAVTAWQEFKTRLESLIIEVKNAFDKCYIVGYPTLQTDFTAQVGQLNVELPTKEELQERFNVEYKMGQVASPDDIRIQGIDQIVRKQIQDDMKQQVESKLNNGLGELAKRLVAAADDIGGRVSDPDQKNKKYTRSIENLNKLADTAEALNVTGNDAIKEACATIRKDIAQWSPASIKDTQIVREHVADAASSISDKLGSLKL